MEKVYMLEINLKKMLEEKKVSVMELARKTGVPKSNISAWLTGASPNLEQLDRVAQFLGTNIDYLAFGRSREDMLANLMDQVDIHSGIYEIKIRKIVKE